MESIQIHDLLDSDNNVGNPQPPIRTADSAPASINFSNVSSLPLPTQIDILQSVR